MRATVSITMPASAAIAAAVAILCAGPAHAGPRGPAETSLDKCQNTVRTEGVKYVQNTQKAIATCLGKVSTEVIKKNAPSVAAAVRACTSQFDKIGRTDDKSIGDVFASKVGAKCVPAPPKVAHTLDDLLGSGLPGVAEPLDVAGLGDLCARYGGDGAIDSAQEWIDCMRAAQACAANAAIASEFPRALEWLNELAAAMPPSAAKNAVIATEAAIDGDSDDGMPDLACAAGSSPVGAQLLATGQTTCWSGPGTVVVPCAGTGQDGETQTGVALSYVDNGDGTVTDQNTGLVWEKKSDDDGLHDKDLCYPWFGICSDDGFSFCARDADCAGPGATCDLPEGDCQTAAPGGLTALEWLDQLNASSFAGHGDWRLPNRRELDSLVNLEQANPCVSAAFDTGCSGGCTVLTCSCTAADSYWSSSAYAYQPVYGWSVNFFGGFETQDGRVNTNLHLRAVRGGS